MAASCLHTARPSSVKARGLSVLFSHPLAPPSPLPSPPLPRPRPSDPFLHGAFTVQYVARRALPLELHHGVDQHQQAQRQHARDDDGHGLHRVRLVVQLDHHVRAVGGGGGPGGVDGCQVAAHEVLEDGTRVARIHPQELVVELPVLLALVEVGES